MPDLALREDNTPDKAELNRRVAGMIHAHTPVDVYKGNVDPGWAPAGPTEWQAVDENVGIF